jgi:DNA mismatch repair ATPase MutS
MSWLTLDVAATNEVADVVTTYLNVFLLLDVHAFRRSMRAVRERRSSWITLLETVGEIDAARSIANFRAGARTTVPAFTPRGSGIVVRALVHPLVRDAVPNDVALDERGGWLVMGSNMSGKSTFLRAVGLSACLAQSIGCVTADEYSAPLLAVRTLIHVEDDVLAGRSHFLAEAQAACEILLETRQGADRLCIIDELFRGTNTADRVAAGSAFLHALRRGGAFVVAATHDAELIPLLAHTFRPHYFQEKVDGGVLAFDYRLREGPMAPRNALAVLELVGFPPDVLADARARLG